MNVDVAEELRPALEAYARISIAYEVREVFDVIPTASGADRYILTPRPVSEPYSKDYDADGNGPASWPTRFDLAFWQFFVARLNGQRVGGAVVVFRAPDVDMLGAQPDLAVLWDIRVATELRGQGIGAALVAAVQDWSAVRGARWLEVETQNINVPACRFYERQGFTLKAANPDAYPTLPHETQLLWRKRLSE